MTPYQTQWNQLQLALVHQRIPQAMLFVGPLHCALTDFVSQLMQLFLCRKSQIKPCLDCLDCRMVERREHPDAEWVKPEKNEGAIKIDQIRVLQHTAYLTPQRSTYRLITIEAADRMNTASANALLKILEEPAKHTVFILVAQQLSTVLPTVLSRCHIFRMFLPDDSCIDNLLLLGEKYPKESERAIIVTQSESILDGLIALIEGKQHPCFLTSLWTRFELSTVLWFLYLVFAQVQHIQINTPITTGPANQQLLRLSDLINPVLIFMQIDKLNTLLRKLSHNIPMNQPLVLDDLLLGFIAR